MARRAISHAFDAVDNQRMSDYFIPSLSADVISYKGLIMPAFRGVSWDLDGQTLESAICVFHQRFSTNTWPQWRLAQPFRYLAHNGEINTIRGNRYWANARATKFKSDLLPDMDVIQPLVDMSGSDSSSLDNMLDFLLSNGMDLFRAMRLHVHQAGECRQHGSRPVGVYEYNSMRGALGRPAVSY